MIPERHSTPPPTSETHRETTPVESQEPLAFSPVYDATERPPLPADETRTYDAWVEEIKAVFANIGAKSSEDFRRILTENPKALTVQELERIHYLMDRVHFAWRHGRLPPEAPEKPGEILENLELPFAEARYGLVKTLAINGKPYFVISDERTGSMFVMNEKEKKEKNFSCISDPQMIGDSLCYEGLKSSGLFTLVVNGKEVSRFETRKLFDDKNLPVFVDVQGKPAWLEFEQEKVFVSLEGIRIGDPEGYDDIKEFTSYEGKLLFQARKGKHWHTILDGKEMHPPTRKEERYQHFGISGDELFYTKTETTNWIFKKTKCVEVYRGETLLHTAKGAWSMEVTLQDLGEGHVATIARHHERLGDLSKLKRQGVSHFHLWMDGKQIGDTDRYLTVEHLRRTGNALTHISVDMERNLQANFVTDGLSLDFRPYDIYAYQKIGDQIFFVGANDELRQVALLSMPGEKVVWLSEASLQGYRNYLPKIDAVFGKLWARVFEKDRWGILFDGKKIPLDKKVDEIEPPIIIGSHVLFFVHADGNYHLMDKKGFSHGTFPSIPLIEPIDEDRCYVYGQEGRNADAKLVRRVIEL